MLTPRVQIVIATASDIYEPPGIPSSTILSLGRTVVDPGDTYSSPLVVAVQLGGNISDYTLSADCDMLVAGTTAYFTIPANDASVNLTVQANPDFETEGVETASFTVLFNSGTYVSGGSYKETIAIHDSGVSGGNVPVVSVSAPTPQASETGPSSAVVRFTRSGTSTGGFTVDFSLGGSATYPDDYRLKQNGVYLNSNQVVFANGQQTVDLVIEPVQDSLVEPTESISVEITSNPEQYTIGGSGIASASILGEGGGGGGGDGGGDGDSDVRVSVSASDSSATEGGGTAMLHFTRTGSTAGNLVVNFVLTPTAHGADPSDYGIAGAQTSGSSGTFYFPAGKSSVDLKVSAIRDLLDETTEWFQLTILSSDQYEVSGSGTATIEIVDVPPLTVSFSPTGGDLSATEALSTGAPDNGQVKVLLNTPAPAGGLTVTYTVSGSATEGTDYQTLTKSVVIPQGSTNATIDVIPYWDGVSEGDETVSFQLISGSKYLLASSDTSQSVTIHDTAASVIKFNATTYSMSEPNGGPASWRSVQFTRTGNISVRQTVQLSFAGTATNNTDYIVTATASSSVTTTSVVFEAGSSTATIYLTPIADSNYSEGTEYVDITIVPQPGGNYTTTSPDQARVNIYDAVLPVISVTATDSTAAEDTPEGLPDIGVFTITRSGNDQYPLTFKTSFATGSATFDNDFSARVIREDGSSFAYSSTLTFGANESTLKIEITPRFDGNGAEGTETAILQIVSGAGYGLGTASATVNISNSPVPSVSFTVTDDDASEDTPAGAADEGTFTIHRTGNLSASASVDYEFISTGTGHAKFGHPGAAGAWDYSVEVVGTFEILSSDTGSVTFYPGQDTITLRVIPRQDTLTESSEEVELEISPADGAFYNIVGATSQSLFIADMIPKTVTITAIDSEASEYGENGEPDPGTFRFTRTGGTSASLTVSYNIAGNSELADFEAYYVSSTGVESLANVWNGNNNIVVIPAGQSYVDMRIRPVVDNKDTEATEDVKFTVKNGTGYLAGSPDDATVEIFNLPRQSVVLSVQDSLAQESGPGGVPDNGAFLLTRSGPAAIINNNTLTVYYDVMVSSTATAGVDYIALSGSVTFDERVKTATVSVKPILDALREGNETVTIRLKNLQGTDYQLDYDVPSNREQTIQIVDGPVPSVTVTATDSTATEWDDAGSLDKGRFKITRDSVNVSSPLTVNFTLTGSAENEQDYEELPVTVTFAANQTEVYLDVEALQDGVSEDDEDVVLTLVAGADYKLGGNSSATVTIEDQESDDTPTVTVTTEATNQDNTCGCSCEYLQPGDGVDFGPLSIDLQSGAVIFNYAIDAGMDAIEAAFFAMSMGRDNPHPIFNVSVTLPEGADVPLYIDAKLKVNGTTVSTTTFQMPTGAVAGATYKFALQTDAADLPTGQFDYSVSATGRYPSPGGGDDYPGALGEASGSVPIFNLRYSNFGRAWGVPNLSMLMPTTVNGVDGFTLFRGNGTAAFFAAGPDGTYTTPDGSFSKMAGGPLGSGYQTLTLQNGDEQRFDLTSGRLLQSKKSTGQVTTYEYDAEGRIETVTDGGGRTFDYTYSPTTGQLSQINDFEGRQWDYVYEGDLLTQVTAPEPTAGAARPVYSMSYDPTTKLLTNVTTPDGVTTTLTYGDDRRFRSLTTSDGQAFSLTSSESQTLPQAGAPENTLIPAGDVATSYTDPAGKTHSYVTDAFGRVIKEIDAAGNVTSYVRDADGQITEQTDPDPDGDGPLEAPVTLFLYDDVGRVLVKSGPSGVESWTYSTNEQRRDPLTYTDALGETTTYSYDADTGNLLSETNPLHQTTTYSYYTTGAKTGLLYQVTTPDPDGAGPRTTEATTYDYFESTRLLKTVTQPDSTTLHYTYDAYGHLASDTDELGNVTTYENDAYGHVLTLTQPDPDGNGPLVAPVYHFVYDTAGRLEQMTDLGGVVTTYSYVQRNGLDLISRIETSYPLAGGGTRTLVESHTYNALGLVTSDVDVQGNVTTYEYDAATSQLLVKMTAPDPDGAEGPRQGAVTTYTYDNLGRQTSETEAYGTALARTSSVEYSDSGMLLTSIDPLGHITYSVYDQVGNLLNVSQLNPDGSAPIDLFTQFTYDALGQVLTATDPAGRTTEYTYYGDGNVATITYPDPDADGPLESPVVHMFYDAMGRLIESIDQAGLSSTYEYTLSGLLERTIFPTGAETSTVYDHLGRPIEEIDEDGRSTDYTYNDLGQLVSETDYLSNVTSYSYDELGLVSSVTYPDPDGPSSPGKSLRVVYEYNDDGTVKSQSDYSGSDALPLRTTQFTYDKLGQLISTTDPLGQTTQYEYDVLGRTVAITDPLLHTTTSTYNALDQLVSVTDATGYTVTQSYDGFNRPIAVYRPEIGTHLFEYDDAGNVISETDEEGRITTYEYDQLDRLISTTDADGGITSYTYNANGDLVATTDPNGNTIYQEFDDFGRLERRGKDLVNNVEVESFTYSPSGLLTTHTDTLGRTTVYNYEQGRLESVVDPISGLIEYVYDNLGNVTSVKSGHYVSSGVDHFGKVSTYAYDTLGRLTLQSEPGEPSVAYEYDRNDQITRETVRGTEVTEYTYDAAGNLVSMVDPRDGETTYTYDAANRRTSTTDPLDHTETVVYTAAGRVAEIHDAAGGVTEMTYTPVGNLASLTDPVGNVTTFDYDNLNRLITETTTDGSRSYQYDAVGNLTWAKDRLGQERTFVYQFDFLTSGVYQQTHEYWWGSSNITPIKDIQTNYDALGRLASEQDENSQFVYDYTALSQLRYVRSDVSSTLEDGTAVGLWYSYDNFGRLSTVSAGLQGANPNGETIVAADFVNTYTYNANDTISSIRQAGVTGSGNNTVTEKLIQFTTDAYGRLTQIDREQYQSAYDEWLPYLRTQFGYDSAGSLNAITQVHVVAGYSPSYTETLNTLQTYSWDYDAAGRVESATTPDGTTNYSYTDDDQLTGADHSTGPDEAYTYDANGNRTNSGYDTGDNNRLLSDGVYNYTYDAEGNRITRTEIATGAFTSYTWDYRQRLVGVEFKTSSTGTLTKQIAYTYDTHNQLLIKQVDNTGDGTFEDVERYVYDGTDVVLQLDDTDNVEHRYLHGPGVDQIFADENALNDVLWALTDNQGTVRDWVSFNAPSVAPTVVEHLQYDAFGQIISDSNPGLDTRFAYTGREWDADAGLYYYRNRWYDPAIGSFISEDPLSFSAGDTNLRRYLQNNPINWIDPFGLENTDSFGPYVIHWHHVFPQEFSSYLTNAGLDADYINSAANGWYLLGPDHRGLHTGQPELSEWNAEWRKWLDERSRSGKALTMDAIDARAKEMLKKYELVDADGKPLKGSHVVDVDDMPYDVWNKGSCQRSVWRRDNNKGPWNPETLERQRVLELYEKQLEAIRLKKMKAPHAPRNGKKPTVEDLDSDSNKKNGPAKPRQTVDSDGFYPSRPKSSGIVNNIRSGARLGFIGGFIMAFFTGEDPVEAGVKGAAESLIPDPFSSIETLNGIDSSEEDRINYYKEREKWLDENTEPVPCYK